MLQWSVKWWHWNLLHLNFSEITKLNFINSFILRTQLYLEMMSNKTRLELSIISAFAEPSDIFRIMKY